MKENKIYLLGGADSKKGDTKVIDSKILSELDNKSVFVINLTTNDKAKIESYKQFWNFYFNEIGIKEINFLSDSNSHEYIKKKINSAGLIYIIGGDTELLIENAKKLKLLPLIKSFKGVILGNSAGAYLLCNQYIRTSDLKLAKGSGLIKINLMVHYLDKFDKQLLELSKDKEIYAISEKSFIIISGKNKDYFGDIHLFSRGEKSKIN